MIPKLPERLDTEAGRCRLFAAFFRPVGQAVARVSTLNKRVERAVQGMFRECLAAAGKAAIERGAGSESVHLRGSEYGLHGDRDKAVIAEVRRKLLTALKREGFGAETHPHRFHDCWACDAKTLNCPFHDEDLVLVISW